MTTSTGLILHHHDRRSREWAVGRCRVRALLRGDRGAVSVELVIATPLLLVMLLMIVQFALWSHATHIAQAAASQGLAAARVQHGTTSAGTASAQQMLDQLARGPLTGPRVHVDRTATTATVRISGAATAVIPFLTLQAEATGPVERFVPHSGFTNSAAFNGASNFASNTVQGQSPDRGSAG
jgi:Flp pilus assembly protein TadG